MPINGDVNEKTALLVTEIQNGNERAFDELYNLTKERAYYVALEFVKKDEDAQDILQESYIKALSKIKQLDKPESFQSWLNQIVANKSKDFLKKKKPMLFEAEENEVYEVLPDEDLNFRPEDSLDQSELQRTVMEVLDELNEEKRACVMMMYFEELSVSEIAQTLEIPEGTVKTRLFSARKDLKEKFSKRGITSAYSVAPIGVVLWAMRRTSATAGATFAASSGSATVLAGITASGVLAASGATAATVTGGGIAAKIAALTVAQKAIASASAAAVVIGGTVGVVTVVNDDDKKDNNPATAYTEEHTTAPYDGTTIVFQAVDGTVEFTLTDISENNENISGTVTVNEQTDNTASTQGTAATSERTSVSGQTTTRATATSRTTRPRSTVPSSTSPLSTRPSSTSTTRPSQTQPSTTAQQTATIIINYTVIPLAGSSDVSDEPVTGTYTKRDVPPDTVMDTGYIWDIITEETSFNNASNIKKVGSFSDTAVSGVTYEFAANVSY